MTDKDTDPAGAAGPGDADVCAETTAGAAGDTGVALGELAGLSAGWRSSSPSSTGARRTGSRSSTGCMRRTSSSAAGLSRIVLEPVVADLIRLHDQLDRGGPPAQAGDGQDAQLLWSFADDVAQILDRCGIDIFSAEPGDPFDRDRHRPLAVVACADEARHNTVAEVAAAGFAERDTGRVRRPLQARFYQYTPARQSRTAARAITVR